jgi:cytidine kinase
MKSHRFLLDLSLKKLLLIRNMSLSSQHILVGGSVAIDNIKTPHSEGLNLLGGSASYTAIASSFYTSQVSLIGIIGKDFPQEHLQLLKSRHIDVNGLEISNGNTFSWTGEYHENMNDRTTHDVAINVLENWTVKVPEAQRTAPLVILANMHPENQMQLLDQMQTADQKAPFVLADTMDLWITIANDRLHDVLKRIDILVINESEARQFASTSHLIQAGKRLLAKGPRFVIIKLGEFGAMLFENHNNVGSPNQFDHEINLFRCPAFPLEAVADPTGAGDSFLGATTGYLATTGKTEFTFEDIKQGMIHGSVIASFTCEAFSTNRLQAVSQAEIDARLTKLKQLNHW